MIGTRTVPMAGEDVLDVSNIAPAQLHGATGWAADTLHFAGAHLARIMHPPQQSIADHSHDWPGLLLYRLGACREHGEGGEHLISGPCALFQPVGTAHQCEIGEHGYETVTLTFDPAWLARDLRTKLPRQSRLWYGGEVAAPSRRLAAAWRSRKEHIIRAETSRFLRLMLGAHERVHPPVWAGAIDEALGEFPSTSALAQRIGRHPAAFARAYRNWRGEGIGATLRRRRVEVASVKLRHSHARLADIAAECGFCDQSHMNRAFRAVLGRTPLDVRSEAGMLASVMVCTP